MDIFLKIIITIIITIFLEFSFYKLFYFYQLSGYNLKNFFKSLKSNNYEIIKKYFYLFFFNFIITFFIYYITKNNYSSLSIIIYIIFCSVFFYLTKKEKVKVKFVFTNRIKRFIIGNFILNLILAFILILLSKYGYYLFSILIFISPLIIALTHLFVYPVEKYVYTHFINLAKSKLNTLDKLIKIGITGSYGKTTAKYLLAHLLSTKYNVCISPKSYNTTMGLCKTINGLLNLKDEIFIAEMGARNSGDISELVDIVNPNISIITNIGQQHLETFKTIENIYKTKLEITKNLKDNDYLVIGNDKELYNHALALNLNCNIIPINDYIKVDNIEINEEGTKFDLIFDNNILKINTKLLGRHVANLSALCVWIALHLGVEITSIKDALKDMQPIPHRLELVKNEKALTVIDDSYNCNPDGLRNALEVLNSFKKLKIIITPGMVELGKVSDEQNKIAGFNIAKVCDYAVFLGVNKYILKEGAILGGMNESKVFIVNNLQEALWKITQIDGEKIILFENDLPDNFSK